MSENYKRRRDLLGGPSTLQINPMTKDFKQPEPFLKKRVTPGQLKMAEIGTVLGLGTAAGYTAGKKGAEDVIKKESKKTTRKGSPMKANPAGGKKKGMGQEERRRYFGVEKKSTGGMMIGKGGDYIKDLL